MAEVAGGSVILASGYAMPLVGLGTSGIRDMTAMSTAVSAALKSGYRLFDTAQGYRNQHLLGGALQEHLAANELSRDQVFITTKVPIINDDTDDRTRHMIDIALLDMQLEYLDLVLIHYPRHLIGGGADRDPQNRQKREIVYRVLEEYVVAGKIRSIGVSNYEVLHLLELPDYAKVPCSVNQCEYHPHHTQAHIREYCKRKGIFFQGFSSLCSGDPAILEEKEVCELAEKYDVPKQNVLLSFALHTGVGILPKSTNPQRIHDNLAKTLSVRLSEAEVESLLNLDRRKTYIGLCTPWRTL